MKFQTLSKLLLGGAIAASVGAFATNASATPISNSPLLGNYIDLQIGSNSILSFTVNSAGFIVDGSNNVINGPFFIGASGGNTTYSTSSSAGALYELSNVTISNSISSSTSYTTASTLNLLALGATLSDTLNILTGSQGFTTPGVPPNAILEFGMSPIKIGGGVTTGAVVTGYGCATQSATKDCGSPTTNTPTGTMTASDINSNTGVQTQTLVTSLPASYTLGNVASINLNTNDTMDLFVTTQLVSVPEPISISLIGTGLIGLAGVYRRRRQA
jgi:hypothetical protein